MAIFNYQKKEIGAKIVYYGPALCGKTTNVQYIHLKLNPRQRGELVSLATDCDRTLFFDFLPIELENIGGFKTRFHIYTVPGQVYYNSTRKAVLTGVDGIVFVADSQRSMAKENVESLQNLRENLQYYNRDMDSIPLIFQYNKQDMPDVMTVEELNGLLNPRKLPYFEAVAIKGTGVLPTLTSCCKLVLQNLKQKSSAAARPEPSRPRVQPRVPSESPPLQAGSPSLQLERESEIRKISPAPETTPGKLAGNRVSTPACPDADTRPLAAGTADLKPAAGEIDYKPEIVRIGKAIQQDAFTVTVPLQIALDAEHNQLLSVDLSFTINHLLHQNE